MKLINITNWLFGKRFKKMNKGQKRLLESLEFLIRLLILAIPLYIIIWLGVSLIPIQAVVASQSGWVLEGMGFQVKQDQNFVTSLSPGDPHPFQFMINDDCTGWKSMLFLFALVFAVPAVTTSKRLWALVFGIPIIWVANIGRVVGVVLAEEAYGVNTALMIHDYLWQLGLIIVVLGIWFVWIKWAENEKRKKGLIYKLKSFTKSLAKGR